MARDHPKKASSSSTKESNTNKSLSTRTSETARDHPKKASSSSKKESNTNMSLTTRNETVSLSQHDKCAIIITRLFRFNKRIKAEIAYDNDRYNRKYAAREKDYVVKKFCANVEKNASNIMKLCYPEESNAMKERIRAYFHHSRSAQSELVKIRREYEQKVTSPLMENLERFSFHEDTAEKNTQIFQLVRFALIRYVLYLQFLCYSLSRQASLSQQKREECWLLRRIRNLVDKSCKRRKLIKDLETKTKAVEAQASLITGEKDKRIIELEATIKEYKENSIGKNKHITELEERLGGGDKNLPLVDSLIMEEKDKRIMELEAIINEYKENLSNKNKHITELEEKLGGGNDNMSHVDNVSLIHVSMI
jgi:hypothetical protein